MVIKITSQATAQLVMDIHVKLEFKMTVHYGNCCAIYIDIVLKM